MILYRMTNEPMEDDVLEIPPERLTPEAMKKARENILKRNLKKSGKCRGVLYTKEELEENYGSQVLHTEAENKVQAYGTQMLFHQFIKEIGGSYSIDGEDILWFPKENKAVIWQAVELHDDTVVIGYRGFKDQLFVILRNDVKDIILYMEVPNVW